MPNSSDELRDRMSQRFGSIDLTGPENYLRMQGYTVTKGGIINGMKDHKPTILEWDCIVFLFEEWDYAYEAHDVHKGKEDATSAPTKS